jgi:tape measure domain-containing protein
VAQANVKLTVDATSATRALQGVQNQTNQLQKAFGGLKTALLGIGFVAVTKNIVSTTVEYQKLEQRLKVLTATNGQYAESVELARQAQVKFGLSGTEALEAITNLQARLGTLGVSMQDMTTIFNGFNTAAILSGASTQEQVGAMRQLIQALGSGVLRGDEFNSIAEQMSAIQGPIAKQLGINVDQLREFAHQGKITKEIVIAAFREIEKDGSKALKELIKNDPSMTFKVLNNSIEMLSIELGKIFVPAVLDGVTALSALVRAVGNFINSDAGQAALILSGIALGVKGISVAYATAQIALSSLAFNLSHIGVQAIIAQQGLTGYSAQLLLATKSTTALTIATGAATIAMKALPVVALAGGFVFLTKSIIRSINKQKEFNRIMTEGSVEELQGQLDKAVEKYLKLEEELERISESGNFIEKLFVENDGQKILEEAGEEIRKIVNRITEVQDEAKESLFKKDLKDLKDVNKSLKDREALLKLGTEEEREALALVQKMEDFKTKFAGMDLTELETLIKDNQELEKKIENLEKAEEAAKALDKQFEQIGKSIEDSIVSNLADAVEGTKTLAEAAVNVLNKLKRKLIEVAIQRAISGLNIGGSIGDFLKDVFKAEGGPVNRGRSYIVGERGPEMFVPNTSGTIVPNNSLAMGGGGVTNVITVNVDSSSSDVQSNDGQANQFGEALAAAIQAELINQKRAGGLLSNT